MRMTIVVFERWWRRGAKKTSRAGYLAHPSGNMAGVGDRQAIRAERGAQHPCLVFEGLVRGLPVAAFQTCAVWPLAVTTRVPSGLQHRALVHVAFMTDHDALGHWIGTAIEFMPRHGICCEAVTARCG